MAACWRHRIALPLAHAMSSTNIFVRERVDCDLGGLMGEVFSAQGRKFLRIQVREWRTYLHVSMYKYPSACCSFSMRIFFAREKNLKMNAKKNLIFMQVRPQLDSRPVGHPGPRLPRRRPLLHGDVRRGRPRGGHHVGGGHGGHGREGDGAGLSPERG